jgi:hypothetical protein
VFPVFLLKCNVNEPLNNIFRYVIWGTSGSHSVVAEKWSSGMLYCVATVVLDVSKDRSISKDRGVSKNRGVSKDRGISKDRGVSKDRGISSPLTVLGNAGKRHCIRFQTKLIF